MGVWRIGPESQRIESAVARLPAVEPKKVGAGNRLKLLADGVGEPDPMKRLLQRWLKEEPAVEIAEGALRMSTSVHQNGHV